MPSFRNDNYENLILLCPNHHRAYYNKRFVLVPSPPVRQRMIQYEFQDFAFREGQIAAGFPDPGRKVLMHPELPYEFEYVPTTRASYLFLRLATRYDTNPVTFVDHQFAANILYFHFQASHYALMVESFSGLAGAVYVPPLATCQAALSEIFQLRALYSRVLERPLQTAPSLATASSLAPPLLPAGLQQALETHNMSFHYPSGLHSIDESTGGMQEAERSSGAEESVASNDTRRDEVWEDVEISASGSADCASATLNGYQAEPAVTVDMIKTRSPLDPGYKMDLWRFKSSADFMPPA